MARYVPPSCLAVALAKAEALAKEDRHVSAALIRDGNLGAQSLVKVGLWEFLCKTVRLWC